MSRARGQTATTQDPHSIQECTVSPPNDSSKNARKPDRVTASQCRSASHGVAAKRLYIRWWSYGSLPYGVCKNAPILFRILACEHAFGMRVIAHRPPGGAAG